MHAIVFSPEAEKVRDFFADVIGLSCVDAGGGWLIFAPPPAELAVHPADGESRHQLYLMCDDIHATLAELRARGAEVAQEVSDQRWGLVAAIRLPDGTEFPFYRPQHPCAAARSFPSPPPSPLPRTVPGAPAPHAPLIPGPRSPSPADPATP